MNHLILGHFSAESTSADNFWLGSVLENSSLLLYLADPSTFSFWIDNQLSHLSIQYKGFLFKMVEPFWPVSLSSNPDACHVLFS